MNTGLRARPLAQARSLLFVPGNRPERFAKALASGADATILDLEDAVPAADKATARLAIAAQWPQLQVQGRPLLLRINAEGGADWPLDLALLARLPGLAGVMCPKVESAPTLARLAEACPLPLLPLIESAGGWQALAEIATAPGVLRLVLGHIDFMADTGISCGADEAELAPLRFALAMQTRLAGLAPAIDGVTVQTDDAERLQADCQRARRYGFGAKLCIHPRQIDGVHAGLRPGSAELAWARRVVEADAAAGGAALQLDGRMIDRPVVLQAQRWLALAE